MSFDSKVASISCPFGSCMHQVNVSASVHLPTLFRSLRWTMLTMDLAPVRRFLSVVDEESQVTPKVCLVGFLS